MLLQIETSDIRRTTQCLRILSEAMIPLLGTRPVCSVVTPTLLRIELGPGATLMPGMLVQLSPNVRPRRCALGSCPTFTSYKSILRLCCPVAPPIPVLLAPRYIGECQNLTLDARGSRSTTKYFKRRWSYSKVSGNAAIQEQAWLSGKGQPDPELMAYTMQVHSLPPKPPTLPHVALRCPWALLSQTRDAPCSY